MEDDVTADEYVERRGHGNSGEVNGSASPETVFELYFIRTKGLNYKQVPDRNKKIALRIN